MTVQFAAPLTPPAPPTRAQARRAMLTWAGVIVGLLSLQVALCVVGVTLAVRGKGVVVESDYYTKALHWDQQKALLQASRDLGWNVGLDVGPTATTRGDRAVVITLVDRAGTPIDDAGVELAYFHHAAPRDLRHVKLLYGIGGLSYGNVSARRPGTTNTPDPQYWMSASGVDKSALHEIGRDILLVNGYDPERDVMRMSIPQGVEPRRVSVDAIEHWIIYREHPEVRAILHVHGWIEGTAWLMSPMSVEPAPALGSASGAGRPSASSAAPKRRASVTLFSMLLYPTCSSTSTSTPLARAAPRAQRITTARTRSSSRTFVARS